MYEFAMKKVSQYNTVEKSEVKKDDGPGYWQTKLEDAFDDVYNRYEMYMDDEESFTPDQVRGFSKILELLDYCAPYMNYIDGEDKCKECVQQIYDIASYIPNGQTEVEFLNDMGLNPNITT